MEVGCFFAAGSNLLTPDWSLFVTVVVFLLVAYLLNTLVFKPVLAVLDERARLTSGFVSSLRGMTSAWPNTKLRCVRGGWRQPSSLRNGVQKRFSGATS
jgi:hypothetical protein